MINTEAKAAHRYRGGVLLLIGAVVALGLAGYGIWSRSGTVAGLKQAAEDAALPRVQLISPKPGPSQRTLMLPGNMDAWYAAPIYAQVNGYVSHWYKDYGAQVKSGDVLATIDTPSLDAQFAASKASLAVVEARYKLAEITAKRYSALSGTQAVSQQDVDIKTAEAAEQKAQVAASEQDVARYQALIAFKQLTAPFDGVVTSRHTNHGTDGGQRQPRVVAGILCECPFYVSERPEHIDCSGTGTVVPGPGDAGGGGGRAESGPPAGRRARAQPQYRRPDRSGLKLTDKIVASPSLGLLEGQQVKAVEPVAGYQPGRASTPVPSLPEPPSGPIIPGASPARAAQPTAATEPSETPASTATGTDPAARSKEESKPGAGPGR
jgi:hypothetical protein